jgi:hypothetical protein
MTTVQIVAIVVASLAALLLVIALVVTRRRSDEPAEEAQQSGSFLDEAPQDTFSVLGKAEQPVEDITLDPAVERAAAASRVAAAEQAQRERQPQPGGLGLDWGPDLSVRGVESTGVHDAPHVDEDEAGATGGLGPEGDATMSIPAGEAAATAGSDTDSRAADDADEPVSQRPATESVPASVRPEPTPPGHIVPLSEVIVTTSSKTVDLDDPDVRRMLTELVTFEIDQAAEFRRQGQTIDAVLQLTEAEKVSRALGMRESAERIRAMMDEIRNDT